MSISALHLKHRLQNSANSPTFHQVISDRSIPTSAPALQMELSSSVCVFVCVLDDDTCQARRETNVTVWSVCAVWHFLALKPSKNVFASVLHLAAAISTPTQLLHFHSHVHTEWCKELVAAGGRSDGGCCLLLLWRLWSTFASAVKLFGSLLWPGVVVVLLSPTVIIESQQKHTLKEIRQFKGG